MVWPQSPVLIRRSRAGRERRWPRAEGKWLRVGVSSWGLLCPLPSPLPRRGGRWFKEKRCLGGVPRPQLLGSPLLPQLLCFALLLS